MQLAKTQQVTFIEEFKTYAVMNRFVILPEGYETKIGLWSLINAITDQDTPDAFSMSHYATEHGQISSYCSKIFSPLDIACNIFMINSKDTVIVFDNHRDIEKYVSDESIELKDAYTLYLTKKFLDELIEIDNEEKKAYCKYKINAAKVKINSFEKQIAQYEEILESIESKKDS